MRWASVRRAPARKEELGGARRGELSQVGAVLCVIDEALVAREGVPLAVHVAGLVGGRLQMSAIAVSPGSLGIPGVGELMDARLASAHALVAQAAEWVPGEIMLTTEVVSGSVAGCLQRAILGLRPKVVVASADIWELGRFRSPRGLGRAAAIGAAAIVV
jgi:hypothetical protein